jgi:predicted SprT family Zn-dependent metalloprotease
MRLRINTAIFLVALITVIWSVRFAVAQERKRRPEFLQNQYQELNRTLFQNSLPPATVEWADLPGADNAGQTKQQSNGAFLIQVDRNSNIRAEDLEDAMEHQTCHVATWGQDEDPHGQKFQDCMAGIESEEDRGGR